METKYAFYREKIRLYTAKAGRFKKEIHLLGTVRLLLVILSALLIVLLKSEGGLLLSGIVVASTFFFVLLMVRHTRLDTRKNYAEAYIQFCRNQLKGLDYDFSAFDGAPEKSIPGHAFCLDLDLFGEYSLFQSINRTVTPFGKDWLANWFLFPSIDKKEIMIRQEAVRELEQLSDLRQHFYVTGSLHRGDSNDVQRLETMIQRPSIFRRERIWSILTVLIPLLWLGFAAGYTGGLFSESAGGLFFIFSFALAYSLNKPISALHQAVNKMEKIMLAYSDLIACIEKETFRSQALTEITGRLSVGNRKASLHIKQLSRYIGVLDQRGSLMGVILNIFTLREIRVALHIESWKKQHAADARQWFDALATFDAYSSLADFAFNHPDYIYPVIADHYFQMEGKALGHPLLHREQCVRNSVSIGKNSCFLIITGANMAGKSTFLRTVGVNFLLACIGAPVCAHSLTVYPAKMMTSLRTSDSLVGNESYFFAELKRLKMVIDRLKAGEELFIILDEILKGTNSADKQKGSFALMKQLVGFGACGIIATHDLALGDLEKDFPEHIKNYCFEADIVEDRLVFPYLLRDGVACNMNACFLMKQMGIII